MLLVSLVFAAVVASASVRHQWTPDDTSGTDELARSGLINLRTYLDHGGDASSCSLTKASKRREWNTLKPAQKKSYITAVKCLQWSPAKGVGAPGAKTRYDDFVVVHIQQTLTIHATGNFLSWHRYFTWAYEQALRNECGYKGPLPYLNWAKLASNPRAAPVFDGSDTSMSGDGAFKEHPPTEIPNAEVAAITLPPANGGGCLLAGPFKDYQVNLGPIGPGYPILPANPQADGLGYNPRCLSRDINSIAAAQLYDANITDLIQNSPDVLTFQNVLQGDFAAGLLGIHSAGHFLISGDPGGDFYVSPGDPYFFLHHAQIDRLWWTWQNQDLERRARALAGTITLFNDPPSRNATLEDPIDLPTLAETLTIGDLMSTVGGPLCYIYV